jgi:hypothetical protein
MENKKPEGILLRGTLLQYDTAKEIKSLYFYENVHYIINAG